jgi:hypothetical protein
MGEKTDTMASLIQISIGLRCSSTAAAAVSTWSASATSVGSISFRQQRRFNLTQRYPVPCIEGWHGHCIAVEALSLVVLHCRL